MITMARRIADDGITAESVMTDGPAWAQDEDPRRDWYAVTLTYRGNEMTVPFGMGPALQRDPTADDVMECLALDASGYVNARGFEDWASEYGYDTDSRQAENTWRLIGEQTDALRAFLGDAFNAYLFETDS